MSLTKNVSIAMLAISLLIIGAVSVSAQSPDSPMEFDGRGMMHDKQNWTNEEREANFEKHKVVFEAVQSAIQDEDFDAFVKATEGNDRFESITKENFSKLVEAHKLMDEARNIMDSLGLEPGPHPGGMRGIRSVK